MSRAAGPGRHRCFQKDAGGNRTHFDRIATSCLAVWLQRQISWSGVEPDPRPSQGRMRSATLRGPKAPRRGIEPRLAVSKTAVPSVTPAGPNIIPTWSRTRTRALGESNAIRYTIGTIKSRRLDSHQHEAVYGTAAFLNRATSAKSRSAPIRTVSSGFGDRLLSQEHTPVMASNQRSEVRDQRISELSDF